MAVITVHGVPYVAYGSAVPREQRGWSRPLFWTAPGPRRPRLGVRGPGRWRQTAQRLSFLLVINVFQTRKEWRSTLFRLNVSRPFFPSSQLSGIVRERLLSRFFSFLVLSARGSCFPTWWTAAFGLSPRDAFARLRVLSGKRRPSLLLPLLSLPFKSPW